MALKLARRHGVNKASQALSLDYYGMKRRLEATPAQARPAPTEFVELSLPAGGHPCDASSNSGTKKVEERFRDLHGLAVRPHGSATDGIATRTDNRHRPTLVQLQQCSARLGLRSNDARPGASALASIPRCMSIHTASQLTSQRWPRG
jgi:hypothetical protein